MPLLEQNILSEKKTPYDMIFVGWGASTCILLIEMSKQFLLDNKKVLILEPSEKLENDKTFCFWANPKDQIYRDYESIVSHRWNKIKINNQTSSSIKPIEYFHIVSSDLYDWSRKLFSEYNIEHRREKVLNIENDNSILIKTSKNKYSAEWAFDSRPPDWKNFEDDRFNISQSFFGLKVELEQIQLETDVYHMMDFRVPQDKSTQFVYILPYSSKTALIELTRFGKKIILEDEAKKTLHHFIKKYFGSYKIIDSEKGVIPMSSRLPYQKSHKKLVNIGTRAGNVKPSTGYAFKNMYNHSKLICNDGQLRPKKVKLNKRFLFYDQLLLIILTIWPLQGKPIFERLFKIKSSNFILKFLDEKTTLTEDLSMFSKLQIWIFIKSVIFWSYWKLKKIIVPILMIVYFLIDKTPPSSELLNLSQSNLIIISVGLLIVGIPHGALDHLIAVFPGEKKITLKFVLSYLFLMLIILLIWIYAPAFGLLLFILYSAWHFGQAETKNWNINSNFIASAWGLTLFSSLFLIHFDEFKEIISILGINLNENSLIDYPLIGNLLLILPSVYAISKRHVEWLMILLFLFLSNYESLLLTFGLYFIFQHSRIGWTHLKSKLKNSNSEMFIEALPFNLGAIFLYVISIYVFKLNVEECLAYFFIFLSAISFPHVLCMHVFYKKN